jgi:hypothetical protein
MHVVEINRVSSRCRSRGGGNPAFNNPVGMIHNVVENTILSAALPELFCAGFPPPRERHYAKYATDTI